MEKKIKNQKFEASSRSHSEGLLWMREKTMWRQKQRNLPIGEKVALFGANKFRDIGIRENQATCKRFVMF